MNRKGVKKGFKIPFYFLFILGVDTYSAYKYFRFPAVYLVLFDPYLMEIVTHWIEGNFGHCLDDSLSIVDLPCFLFQLETLLRLDRAHFRW